MPCFPSLARAEKKLLRLAGEVARRAGGVSHPRIIPREKQKGRYDPPHGEQNGHYGRREGNKRALWPPHGEQKGRYAPVGVRPPPPLRGSSPCEAGQFIPAGFDCRHSGPVETKTPRHPIASIHFPGSVKSPRMRAVPDEGVLWQDEL